MQDALALFPYVIALVSSLAGVMAWMQNIRFSNEYRAATEQAMKAKDAQLAQVQEALKSKDAQIAQIQESLKTKDAAIENLKLLTYAEAGRHLAAQKELYEARVADLTQTLTQAEEGRLLSAQEVEQLRKELAETKKRREDVSWTYHNLGTLSRGIDLSQVGAVVDFLATYDAFIQRRGRSPRGDTSKS